MIPVNVNGHVRVHGCLIFTGASLVKAMDIGCAVIQWEASQMTNRQPLFTRQGIACNY